MSDIYLISFGDFIPYEDLSFNIDSEKTMKPFILQAQIADLLPLLGSQFYYDLLINKNEPHYFRLIHGKEYTIEGTTFPIQYMGLKAYLCYSAFARYASRANIKSTATGFKIKTNEFSENVDWRQVQSMVDQARSLAKIYEEGLAQYLHYNKSDYPVISSINNFEGCEGSLWRYGYFNRSGRGGRSKISIIG